MRPLSILLICLFLTAGCSGKNNSETSISTFDRYQDLTDTHEKILFFQQLVDRSLQWRSEALSFYDYIEKREIYSNQDLLILHKQGTEQYQKLRGELLTTFRNVEWITKDNVQIRFVDEPTTIEVQEYEVKESSAENAETVLAERTIVHLNPSDAKGQRYIKETKTGLAAALLLYDNYLLVISQYQELKKTRRILNYDNHQTRKFVATVASNYLNPDNYRRAARALSMFEEELLWEQKHNTSIDEDNEYLNLLIKGSYTYGQISRSEGIELLPGNIKFITTRLTDTLNNTSDELTYLLIQSFSNVIGLVETRKGKMTALDDFQRSDLADKLKPLDLLLEKTPFRLTDKTIPGFWGHVGLWIGDQQDLEELGIWNHPLVKPYQQNIRDEKRRIVEALLAGVQINSLEHFLNIDALAVLRPVSLNRQERQKAVLRAFAQLGKEYDYNFDVETDKRIVCSEIAYVVFNNYDWDTENIWGRATISPDNVAHFAEKTGKFHPVILYLNGEAVAEDLKLQMKNLLNKK